MSLKNKNSGYTCHISVNLKKNIHTIEETPAPKLIFTLLLFGNIAPFVKSFFFHTNFI